MRTAALFSLSLTLALAACERTKAASTAGTAAPAASAARAAAVKESATSATKIAKIVFIDKENACDCTRKRMAETWTAMQTALGKPATLPVERIHIDTQAARAEAYTTFRPLMVAPGIYFVDPHDGVVEMLQGEVKTEQIAAVLNGR